MALQAEQMQWADEADERRELTREEIMDLLDEAAQHQEKRRQRGERYHVTDQDRHAWELQRKRESEHLERRQASIAENGFRVATGDWSNPQEMHVSTFRDRAAYQRSVDGWRGPDGRIYDRRLFTFGKGEQPRLRAMAAEVGASVYHTHEEWAAEQ